LWDYKPGFPLHRAGHKGSKKRCPKSRHQMVSS
jgi:hypothetical protein